MAQGLKIAASNNANQIENTQKIKISQFLISQIASVSLRRKTQKFRVIKA